MRKVPLYLLVLTVASTAVFTGVYAGGELNPDMQALVDSYLAEARKKDPGLKAFRPEEGKKLFFAKRAHSVEKGERGCTSCHTEDPSKAGKTPVGKPIDPLSPAVNKDRFTDPKKVEKWFKRNCTWVLERECTAAEKGDFIAHMMSL